MDRQIDGLQSICDELHIEKLSAVADNRPVFDAVISKLKPGDCLVVWDLDRAFRSVIDAIQTAEKLRQREVEFQICTLNIDTAEPAGEFIYTIMAAWAQFDRRNRAKMTREGMAAAKRRGKVLGRPRKLTIEQVELARAELEAGTTTAEMAAKLDVSKRTLERALVGAQKRRTE